jgi:hypothetical protein
LFKRTFHSDHDHAHDPDHANDLNPDSDHDHDPDRDHDPDPDHDHDRDPDPDRKEPLCLRASFIRTPTPTTTLNPIAPTTLTQITMLT